MKRNFLVVAGNSQLRESLAGNLIGRGFTVTRASSALEAERIVGQVSLDAVLIESHLPDMAAEELRKRLLKIRPDCRVVVVSSFDQVRNSAALLQEGTGNFLIRTDQIYEMLHSQFTPKGESSEAGEKRGTDSLIQVVDVLVGLIELDDVFFGGMSHKAMRLAREVAEVLSSDGESIQELAIATLLRDIGKVGVDPEVMNQKGELSDTQREMIKEHVTASLRLFEHIDFPWNVLPIIRHHHERYDGSGYPERLRGREIPLGARIVSVVDAYVAMTSSRHHRMALDPDEAIKELINEAGRQFDPEVIEAVQKVLDKRLAGRGSSGKPRVLVVDGHGDFRRLLKMRLLNEGLEVDEAATCEKGLERLLKEPPDLVLADADESPSEAFELFQEMREDEGLRRVPFSFMSTRIDRVVKIRALRQGVDDFLCKDDDLEELVARVGNILTREAVRRDSGARRSRRGITGDLENLSLPDIVQTLAMGMKTACLTISSNGNQGTIWFENGATKHAKAGKESGEEAFYEMVTWTSGEFVIEHGVQSKRSTVSKDSMFLLMEGLRRLDESRQENSQAAS